MGRQPYVFLALRLVLTKLIGMPHRQPEIYSCKVFYLELYTYYLYFLSNNACCFSKSAVASGSTKISLR